MPAGGREPLSLRDLGFDDVHRVGRPLLDDTVSADVAEALANTVVLAVGRGGVLQAGVCRMLKTLGVIVMVKTSAAAAVQMLGAFVPSLVVTELSLDEDDGLAVLRNIRKLPPEHGGQLPVIGVSADPIDADALIREGFQDVLVSPFDAEDVWRAVVGAIRRPN